jgi:hypothetical protein
MIIKLKSIQVCIKTTLAVFVVALVFGCDGTTRDNDELSDSIEFDTSLFNSNQRMNPFDNKDSIVVDGLKKLEKVADRFEPKSIDFSRDLNVLLTDISIDYIFQSNIVDSVAEIGKVILLKGYLYHLKRANQGYDLYTMRKGKTKKIIDCYLLTNEIDTSGEFLNSGFVWEIERSKSNNHKVKDIVEAINVEKERIMNL